MLENRLFSGKMDAYRSGNKEIIAKFHTALGIIYAARKQWRTGAPQNGIFQLENAIKYSPASKNTVPLKVLLVEGYLTNRDFDSARELLIDAATDYLNDDNLITATHILHTYDSLHGDNHSIKYQQIKKILNFRNKIPFLTDSTIADIARLNLYVDSLTNETKPLPSYFYKIQKFKILGDLGTRATALLNMHAAGAFHLDAMQQASELNIISNLNDVDRLNEQEITIRKVMRFNEANGSGSPVRNQNSAQEFKSWLIQTDGFIISDSEHARIPSSVLVAANIVNVINNSEELSTLKPQLLINEENKTVDIFSSAESKLVAKQLEKTVEQSDMTIRIIKDF